MAELVKAVAWMEKETGKKFGDPRTRCSSPSLGRSRFDAGMMDTILNLGLNDETTEGLKKATSNGRFAWDSYRRFLQMYGDVVMGVQKRHENEHEPFDEVMDHLKEEVGVKEDVDLTEEHLQETGQRFKKTDQGSHRQAIPERADEATGRRDQRGLRFVDERTRHSLSSEVSHS